MNTPYPIAQGPDGLRKELEKAKDQSGEYCFLYQHAEQQALIMADTRQAPAKIWYNEALHHSARATPQVEETIAQVFGAGRYQFYDYYELIKEQLLAATLGHGPQQQIRTLPDIQTELEQAKNKSAWTHLPKPISFADTQTKAGLKTHGLFGAIETAKHTEKVAQKQEEGKMPRSKG